MRDQEKICREEWFKAHEARLILGPPKGDMLVTMIEWRNPKSWNYGCRFIIHSQWLCVVGDMGEATYQWGENITMKFLGSLNFDYFMGKCRASPDGKRFKVWCADAALAKIQVELDSCSAGEREFMLKIDRRTPKDEFDQLLHEAHNDGDIDCDFASHICDAGYIPDPMSVGHFVGLQMAIKQLGIK